jgi:DNA invertase Pin-like site-specific DNA recombinase
MIVGYARVSSDGQSLEVQDQALRQAGAARVYAEKVSGAVTDRAALKRMVGALNAGDVAVVTKLDRLARSTRDLLNTLKQISDAGAGFKVLDNPTLDTTSSHGKLLVGLLAIIAEFERDLIRSRCEAGRRAAKARGQHLGRPSKLNLYQRQEAYERFLKGESASAIARSYGVNQTTVSRLVERRNALD